MVLYLSFYLGIRINLFLFLEVSRNIRKLYFLLGDREVSFLLKFVCEVVYEFFGYFVDGVICRVVNGNEIG